MFSFYISSASVFKGQGAYKFCHEEEMSESSAQPMQEGISQELYSAIRSSAEVYVYEDVAYATPGIPKKVKRANTEELERPKEWNNPKKVREKWANIYNPKLAKNPKSLREAACARLSASKADQATTNRVWLSGLPQYMVPLVHYCPEVVDAAVQRYNLDTHCIEGHNLRVQISPEAIWHMLCISDPKRRKENIEHFPPK